LEPGRIVSAPERTALYRLYDADDQLLYIGIAKDPEARWASHATTTRSSKWWHLVARKTVEWLPSREAADAAETRAIAAENPYYNQAKRDDVSKRRFRFYSKEIRWVSVHLDPASVQVARIIKAEIASGAIPTGALMPTARQLAERFGITDQTMGKMLRTLADEGVIHQKKPRGRFYCS
jgi:predicted GIY-YIG superfamily endonuclease